ncbi:alpha/beta hydrolase [Nakamurella flavida]|uniref:Alpha/beta hydrolase n=1 Tax=Nakamurella flavida TaxID=363630 RepID=A0A939C4H3_9ACTN|nr:alpha/beta hydrolase [Nakamurella flavida]MBM9478096.1 alpha/beta hydrolase [Nakamurella flavida]MDP9778683.1 pimeloyl-ACP methyl ester carboxylesterase [Nakamurella flavida]
MPTLEVEPGIRLAYTDQGTGQPLVFVHGFGGSGDSWRRQVAALSDRFRVITVDLRGHGRSTRSSTPAEYGAFVHDLRALFTELDLRDVTLIGWSMGGHIALKYALDIGDPVTRLVLTGSGPRFKPEPGDPLAAAVQGVAALLGGMGGRPGATPAATGEADLLGTLDKLSTLGLPPQIAAGLGTFRGMVAEDLTDRLPTLTVPLAVFTGRRDPVWPPRSSEALVALIPGAELHVFERSGHAAFADEADAWNAALLRFIAAHP